MAIVMVMVKAGKIFSTFLSIYIKMMVMVKVKVMVVVMVMATTYTSGAIYMQMYMIL